MSLEEILNVSDLNIGSLFSIQEMLLSLTVTFLTAMFIYWVYKKTYAGVLYSKNFNITLVMLALIINAIVMGLSGNIILSLGMVGSLSIIRYRTAIKDPRDTAFLFWALTVGLINGVAYYQLSLMTTAFIALTIFFLTKTSSFDTSYVLILKYEDGLYNDSIKPIIKKSFSSFMVRSDSSDGELIEKVIEVKLKKDLYEDALRNLRSIKGVHSSILLASNGEFAE